MTEMDKGLSVRSAFKYLELNKNHLLTLKKLFIGVGYFHQDIDGEFHVFSLSFNNNEDGFFYSIHLDAGDINKYGGVMDCAKGDTIEEVISLMPKVEKVKFYLYPYKNAQMGLLIEHSLKSIFSDISNIYIENNLDIIKNLFIEKIKQLNED